MTSPTAPRRPAARPSARPAQSPRPRGLFRARDPLRRHREIHGRRARIRWWHRVRAILILAALVIVLGILLAGMVAILFLFMTFVLEAVS